MARFPTREGDIKTLAQNIATGLTDSAAIYPAPPVTVVALQAALDSFITLSDEAVAARAAAEVVSAAKNASLKELTDAMKAVLRYAEDTVASYKIERRERPTGDWVLISVAIETEATLTNQERGKDWEYRVFAVNRAGDGAPSNTVAVVL